MEAIGFYKQVIVIPKRIAGRVGCAVKKLWAEFPDGIIRQYLRSRCPGVQR